VFSQGTESSFDLSSLSPDECSPPWIGANGAGMSCMAADSLDRDDGRVADTYNPEPFVAVMPESAVVAWNRIRLLMAIAPFQTLVRPTSEDGCISKVVSDCESAGNVFRYVGPLGRRFDPDDPQLYVRSRCFAPTLGRFMPRDAL